MQGRVDPARRGRTQPNQARAVPDEHRLLAPIRRLGMDLGDQPRDPHPGQNLGVDLVALAVGLGDGPKLLGVREHEADAVLTQQLVEPRPCR